MALIVFQASDVLTSKIDALVSSIRKTQPNSSAIGRPRSTLTAADQLEASKILNRSGNEASAAFVRSCFEGYKVDSVKNRLATRSSVLRELVELGLLAYKLPKTKPKNLLKKSSESHDEWFAKTYPEAYKMEKNPPKKRRANR